MRRGTSLAEVLIFGLMALAVIAIALGIMTRTSRQSAHTSERLRGLQAVGTLTERLAQDLAANVAYTEAGGRDLRVTVGADGRSVELYHFDPDPKREQPADPVAAGGAIAFIHVERVAYTFDPVKNVVLRQVGTQAPQPALVSRFLSVKFSLPAAGRARFLGLKLDWIPEERLGRPVDERGEATRFECMLGLEGDSGLDSNPYRVANLTSKFTL